MRLFVVRHGETNLNKEKRMQGLTDAPINEKGFRQAMMLQTQLKYEYFDAVFSSPYRRAIITASIISNVNEPEIIKDARLSEVDFGKYELKRFRSLGISMTLHWLYPAVFPAPKTVEGFQDVRRRVDSFLSDLGKYNYEKVLICSHGNLIRVLNYELSGGSGMVSWRDFPQNCVVRTFDI